MTRIAAIALVAAIMSVGCSSRMEPGESYEGPIAMSDGGVREVAPVVVPYDPPVLEPADAGPETACDKLRDLHAEATLRACGNVGPFPGPCTVHEDNWSACLYRLRTASCVEALELPAECR